MSEKIAVIGLGYVGLPVALSASKYYSTIGFDIDQKKIENLKNGIDPTQQFSKVEIKASTLQYSSHKKELEDCNFFIVTVPTPIDRLKKPDLSPLLKASQLLGEIITKNSIVVFESTVYPGVTEEYCGPIIEKISGLKSGLDFFLGYSPEQINPGDKERTLENITKIISAQNPQALKRIEQVYGKMIKAGLYLAESIKVAEAAKVIENTQRDLNIAFVNELAIIFDKMGINTQAVLKAAGTKWNFLKFSPGLVGGHCIGVDPYYLTAKAEELGYHPQVILSGRRINDNMGSFIAQKTIKLMIANNQLVKGAKIGILGITFKENVPDIRNSRVPDIIHELNDFGVETLIFDPIAEASEVQHEYGLKLCTQEQIKDLDALILAVSHRQFCEMDTAQISGFLKPNAVLVDVKSILKEQKLGTQQVYWSL